MLPCSDLPYLQPLQVKRYCSNLHMGRDGYLNYLVSKHSKPVRQIFGLTMTEVDVAIWLRLFDQ